MDNYFLLYFLKGKHGGWISWLISFFSGKYSHVEIFFPAFNWRFASDKKRGTHRFMGEIKKSEKYKWDMIRINCSENQNIGLFEFLNLRVGRPYDINGFFNFIFSFIQQDKDKYYCTEYILEAMKAVKLYSGNTQLTPNKMFEELNGQNNYDQTSSII